MLYPDKTEIRHPGEFLYGSLPVRRFSKPIGFDGSKIRVCGTYGGRAAGIVPLNCSHPNIFLGYLYLLNKNILMRGANMDTPLEGTATGTLKSGPPDSLEVNVTLNPAPTALAGPTPTPAAPADPSPDPDPSPGWKKAGIGFILVSVLWVAGCVLFPSYSVFTVPVQWFWIFNIVIFAVDGIAIGYCLRGTRLGILINEQRSMSLSRLQVAFWTLLVLSALFTMIAVRIRMGVSDPVNIFVDEHLWAVMGISLGSFAGKSAIMGQKRGTDPGSGSQVTRSVQMTALRMNKTTTEILNNYSIGVLFAHRSIKEASFTDMFKSEEVSNKTVVDLGKVQMFLFTVITVAAYAGAIWTLFLHADMGSVSGLPPLSDGFVALLFVSHAGLIANSATTATPVQN